MQECAAVEFHDVPLALRGAPRMDAQNDEMPTDGTDAVVARPLLMDEPTLLGRFGSFQTNDHRYVIC